MSSVGRSGNDPETYWQRFTLIVASVPSRTPAADATEHRRAAVCECGARLVGETEADLYAAAEEHLALHHPHLRGALSPATLVQMAEDAGR